MLRVRFSIVETPLN